MNIVLARETQSILRDAIKYGIISDKSLRQICEIINNDIQTEIDYAENGNVDGVIEIKLVKELVEGE